MGTDYSNQSKTTFDTEAGRGAGDSSMISPTIEYASPRSHVPVHYARKTRISVIVFALLAAACAGYPLYCGAPHPLTG